jgi:hypothetical protein
VIAPQAASARTRLRALIVLVVLVTAVVAVQQRHRVVRKLHDPAGGHISDFDRWMIMTPRFLHDQADYLNDEMPTPPLTLVAFAPFTWMSRPNATCLWVCMKLGFAAIALAFGAAIVARAGNPLSASALALIIVAWSLVVVSDMQEGQTNFMALLPLIAGLSLAQRETTWSDTAAGTLIALGAAVKITPIVFVAYFLWRRRWRIVGAAALSMVCWWGLIPTLAFGWQQNSRWFTQWANIMLLPYIVSGKIVYATSQSFPSFALRLLSRSPAFQTRHDVLQPHFMNVAALSPDTVHLIVRLVMILVAVAGLWWMRRPLASLRSARYVVEIAAVGAFMLWFSERTWVHHYVSFVLMLCAAGMLLSDPHRAMASRRRVRAAIWVFILGGLTATEFGQVFGPDGIDWAHALGAYLLPSIVVTAVVLHEASVEPRDRAVTVLPVPL